MPTLKKKVVGSDTVLLAVHLQHPLKSTAVHLNCLKEVAYYSWRDGSVGEVLHVSLVGFCCFGETP